MMSENWVEIVEKQRVSSCFPFEASILHQESFNIWPKNGHAIETEKRRPAAEGWGEKDFTKVLTPESWGKCWGPLGMEGPSIKKTINTPEFCGYLVDIYPF